MKEKAKLQKQQRNRTVHQVGKRLQPEEEKKDGEDDKNGAQDKRKNLGGGKAQHIPAQSIQWTTAAKAKSTAGVMIRRISR